MQLVRLKWLLLFYYFVNILLFLSQYTSFRDVINAVFYNKYNSITSRNELWIYFITKSLHRPFFGYGASSGAYRNLPENYYKWIMQGNTHNSNIEIIYHYGYVLFVLFSILLFLVAKNKKTSKQVTIYSEYALFIWLMHGLVENGFSYIFLYIPFVIYGEKLDNNLSKEKRFIIISRDFG
ncbi:MAG: O-antigen ligase family protein [Lachnospiraceae bacterium]|nr:O-antigen ligase family protein [Lachnospiraceae bacterium]